MNKKTTENITKSDNIRNDTPYVNELLQRITPLVITPTAAPAAATGKRAYPYPDVNPKKKPTGGKYKTRKRKTNRKK